MPQAARSNKRKYSAHPATEFSFSRRVPSLLYRWLPARCLRPDGFRGAGPLSLPVAQTILPVPQPPTRRTTPHVHLFKSQVIYVPPACPNKARERSALYASRHLVAGRRICICLPIQAPTRPVQRSSARTNTHRISGTGLNNGRTTLRESLAVSPDGQTLTANYPIYRGDRILANGIAIFEETAIIRALQR